MTSTVYAGREGKGKRELEHERMRVEVALERGQVNMELKFELIKEGKAHDSLMTRGTRSEPTGVFEGYEVAESLCLRVFKRW